MCSKQHYPGEPLAVCADCGARVVVPTAAGIPPYLTHEPECGREGWPIDEAIKYEDGLTATINDWPNGIDHATGRDISAPEKTDARAYVETSARGLIEDLAALQAVAGEEASYELINDRETLESLGVEVDPDGLVDADSAIEALYALPLAVEATTTFEVVLGTGGPDRRLCFECDRIDLQEQHGSYIPAADRWAYAIRRVFYRYSWEGSAEFELTGEDRKVAEAFGRRVIPELGE